MSHVSCLRYCLMVYCTPKKNASPPTHSGLRIWDDLRIASKFTNFQANLQGMKIGPKAIPNHEKSILKSKELQFLRKLIFAITSLRNPCFCNPRHPNSNPKSIRKSNLEIDMQKSSFLGQSTQKASKIGPQNHKKSIKSKPGPPSALCCAPQCPKIVPGSPRLPTWSHQACQRSKNTKIRLQQCQESAILEQWAMVGGRRQRA